MNISPLYLKSDKIDRIYALLMNNEKFAEMEKHREKYIYIIL